ncbi:hypothetical protein ACJX0J_039348, partial [Zea mays]
MGFLKANMGTKARPLSIGEIDTRAPFESVKAAVSLFGEIGLELNKFHICFVEHFATHFLLIVYIICLIISWILGSITSQPLITLIVRFNDLNAPHVLLLEFEQLNNAETTKHAIALAELDDFETSLDMRNDFDPAAYDSLKEKLEQTNSEVASMQKKIEDARAQDLEFTCQASEILLYLSHYVPITPLANIFIEKYTPNARLHFFDTRIFAEGTGRWLEGVEGVKTDAVYDFSPCAWELRAF